MSNLHDDLRRELVPSPDGPDAFWGPVIRGLDTAIVCTSGSDPRWVERRMIEAYPAGDRVWRVTDWDDENLVGECSEQPDLLHHYKMVLEDI